MDFLGGRPSKAQPLKLQLLLRFWLKLFRGVWTPVTPECSGDMGLRLLNTFPMSVTAFTQVHSNALVIDCSLHTLSLEGTPGKTLNPFPNRTTGWRGTWSEISFKVPQQLWMALVWHGLKQIQMPHKYNITNLLGGCAVRWRAVTGLGYWCMIWKPVFQHFLLPLQDFGGED